MDDSWNGAKSAMTESGERSSHEAIRVWFASSSNKRNNNNKSGDRGGGGGKSSSRLQSTSYRRGRDSGSLVMLA